MKTDVAGRVKNVQLPLSKPLLPLFEAINNSIEAIEEAREENGKIRIELIRSDESVFSTYGPHRDRQHDNINEFVIRDNGIGFNNQNYLAFETSDTTFKSYRGGKGIGRFMWLAAYESAEIESVFYDGTQAKRRKFTFCCSESGIENHSLEEIATATARETIVRLKKFKEKYHEQCPKRIETIAAYIVEEFLDVFLRASCPHIMLYDESSKKEINLDSFYEKEMVSNSQRKQIIIKNHKFDIIHIRLYSTHITEHHLYLCAHDRVVTRERITQIPNLIRRLQDKEGRDFVYSVYVNSNILDETVNPDRTGFILGTDESELLKDTITLFDIKKAVLDHCKEYLSEFTEPIAKKKRERIEKFVVSEGIMYRPILKHLEHRFDRIKPDASNEEIDLQLYEASHELQLNLKKEGTELVKTAAADDVEYEKFRERFDKYFETISELNQAHLARYVCDRKAIIDFLNQQLTRKADGKYRLEDRIHSIIFPRGKTSNDVFFKDHNLWLIDERLAFHVYLSSDKPINKLEPLQNLSKKELDIIIFDKAVAFSESQDVPFTSITIMEFKRPQRNEYNETENPFTQTLDYIREIKAGKAKLADGRILPIKESLPFYCYIICDMTNKLKRWAENFELEKTPDELGYFGYKRHFNAYFEVISYSKLIADAEKRNRAFFEKLGLPKQI